LLAAVGEGSLGVSQAIRRLVPDADRPASVPVVRRAEATGRVIVGDGHELLYSLAACCRPTFPQPIIGYITRGSGITVHTHKCRNLPSDSERYVSCRWETLDQDPERLVCQLKVTAFNRVGLISDVTSLISSRGHNIGSMATHDNEDGTEAEVSFVVEVPDLFVLADLIHQLERLPSVSDVRRV
jgi:(p)ppGpp synthase/HD superfamily hydrolase